MAQAVWAGVSGGRSVPQPGSSERDNGIVFKLLRYPVTCRPHWSPLLAIFKLSLLSLIQQCSTKLFSCRQLLKKLSIASDSAARLLFAKLEPRTHERGEGILWISQPA